MEGAEEVGNLRERTLRFLQKQSFAVRRIVRRVE